MRERLLKKRLWAVLLSGIMLATCTSTAGAVSTEGAIPEDAVFSEGAYYRTGDIESDTPPDVFIPYDEDLPFAQTEGLSQAQSASAATASSLDLSATKYFPPIQKQEAGDCASFAVTYYQFTYEQAKLNNWDANQEQYQMSPAFTYSYLTRYIDDSYKGTAISDTHNILKYFGGLSLVDYAYTSNNIANRCSSDALLQKALQHRVSQWTKVQVANDNTPIVNNSGEAVEKIKDILTAGHVITFSTIANFDTAVASNGEKAAMYAYHEVDDNGKPIGHHAMTIVGYDDTITCSKTYSNGTKVTLQGALKVANSWGSDWGNKGYIWVMYDALNITSKHAVLNDVNRNSLLFDNYSCYYMDVANYTPKYYFRCEVNNGSSANVTDNVKIGLVKNSKVTSSAAPTYSGTTYMIINQARSNVTKTIFYLDLTTLEPDLIKDELYNHRWGVYLEGTYTLSCSLQLQSAENGSSNVQMVSQGAGISKSYVFIAPGTEETYTKDGSYICGVSPQTLGYRFMYNYSRSFNENANFSIDTCNYGEGDMALHTNAYVEVIDVATGKLAVYRVVMPGDLNGDGQVTVTDVTLIHKQVLDDSYLTGAYQKAADINGDGQVTATDVVLLRQMVLAISPLAFEEEPERI